MEERGGHVQIVKTLHLSVRAPNGVHITSTCLGRLYFSVLITLMHGVSECNTQLILTFHCAIAIMCVYG